MKRDITIPISAALLLIGLAVLCGYEIIGDKPLSGRITKESPEWQIVTFAVIMIAGLRAAVLWFQTLLQAVRPGNKDVIQLGWLIGHFIFGFIVSYFYYFTHRTQSDRR